MSALIDKDALQKAVRAFVSQLRAFAEEVRRLEAPTADDIEAIGQPQPEPEPTQAPRQLYYLQDARQYVGNCVLWWRKNGAGYTTELDEAELYEADSIELKQRRETDVPWAKEIVEAAICRHVRAEALRKPEDPQPEAQPPIEAQTPKPHACPRCDEGMREIEITRDLTWASPRGDYKAQEGQRLRVEAVDEVDLVLPGGWCLLLCGGSYRFTHPSVPPRSEWCDGSGKR